ncbi:Cohesin subunit SA-1 (SCC3 homolog 1) (Stromal antigen 1) [Durusdinium trenchii]|uniref:Cohesin subunit SA-1 (SCC3 homolog 1) (Stromal antigen 1) n=1 Tax=Durusdinium trenchii TaxID=1381693 RepID=A0ABP0NBS9_9DINO
MTSGPGDAVVEDQEEPPAPAEGTLAHQILYGSATDVKLRAQEWASLCSRDLAQALLVVLDLTLALSGLPGAVTPEDLEAEPALLVIRLPDWVRSQHLDPTIYPICPSPHSSAQSRKSISNLENFLRHGISEQNGAALLDSHLVTSLSRWLLVLHAAAIRSVRHVSTIAALSVAEALGHQYHALSRSHETLSRQLQTVTGNVTARQAGERVVGACFSHAREMSRARNQLLETIVPLRSRDISEVIRVYTLSQVDRLMKVDPEMYLQNKWTARVFLMVHDPHVEVRLKALSVIMQWFLPDKKKSAAVREHLGQFAKNCLPHLVERVGDVEPRVAQMALRCLRQKDLAENLKSEEFELVVNLVIGSRDMAVREEAALFVNTHVFQDPGICSKERSKKRGRDGGGGGDQRDKDHGRDEEDDWQADPQQELYNSEVAISMLIEYIDEYMKDRLRICERLVGAFWPRSPALSHWSTMVNLCMVGEGAQRVGQTPITSRQRLCLLYVMEAAVRRADDEVRTARPSEKDNAATRMNEACMHIIPEIPRLMDLCRPEEEQFLLLTHVCKMLVEYAVQSAQSQVLVNSKVLCQGLRKAIEDLSPMETMKNSADSLLALARCFEEAKNTFLDLSKEVHRACSNILEDEKVKDRFQELRPVMSRFLVLANRGIDTSFGSMPMVRRMLKLLHERVELMKAVV